MSIISVPVLRVMRDTVSKAFLIGPAAEDRAQQPAKHSKKNQHTPDDNSLTLDGQSCVF